MCRLVCLATLTVAATALAAPVPKEVKKQVPKLDGTWEVTEQHSRGNKVNVTTTIRWTIDGEALSIERLNKQGGVALPAVPAKAVTATYTLVRPENAEGNALDYVITYNNGGPAPRNYPGVFELDGDTLKFCYVPTAGKAGAVARPTECKPDESNVMFVFKRVDPAK
jgi:uncharacterized protein (TIGR03067 family)